MKQSGDIPPLLGRTGLRFARRGRGAGGGFAVVSLEVEMFVFCDGVMRQEKFELPLYLPEAEAIARFAIVAVVLAGTLFLCAP